MSFTHKHTDSSLQSELYSYRSLTGSLMSVVRMGPSELMRGFVASSLRDAPYAGLFVVVYEGIKSEASKSRAPIVVMDHQRIILSIFGSECISDNHSQRFCRVGRSNRYDGHSPL